MGPLSPTQTSQAEAPLYSWGKLKPREGKSAVEAGLELGAPTPVQGPEALPPSWVKDMEAGK